MAELPIVTCREEGGLYSPDRNPDAPIRIYEDGRLEDGILGMVRERYSAEELGRIVAAAAQNRECGSV